MSAIDDPHNELNNADKVRILALLSGNVLGPTPHRWHEHVTRWYQEESRLKFNAVVPATVMVVGVVIEDAAGTMHRGEMEILYWHLDQEWELTELTWS